MIKSVFYQIKLARIGIICIRFISNIKLNDIGCLVSLRNTEHLDAPAPLVEYNSIIPTCVYKIEH